MKEKDKRVELRLPAKEKEQLKQLAKKCGLSLSEYLRKRGLGYEPGPFLDDRFYAVYAKLCEISNMPLQPETEMALLALVNDIRNELILPRKQTRKEVAAWQRLDSGQSKDG